MADAAEKIFDEALKLPDSDRRALAVWLLDSVGEEPSEDIERAWRDEARERLEDVRAGRAQTLSLEEARALIFDRTH